VAEPTLRVGLAEGRERATISLRSPFRLPDGAGIGPVDGLEARGGALHHPDGRVLAEGPAIQLTPTTPDGTFVLHGFTVGAAFHWQQQQDLEFRGGLHLRAHEGKVDVIDEVGLEAYLESVISSEMSPRCPPALLRAHAVISRSWLLAMLEGGTTRQRSRPPAEKDGVLERIVWYDREDHTAFDVCADDHCQRYQGVSRTTTREAVEAVQATRGLVLTHDGTVCDARFSKACGGRTELFSAAWGDFDPEYLQSFPDHDGPQEVALPLTDEANAQAFIDGSPPAFCNTTDRALLERILPAIDHETRTFYRWEEVVTAVDVRAWVQEKAGVDVGEVRALVPLERAPSGRLVKLAIEGSLATMHVGKELEIRRLLSKSHLYSSAFTVRTDGPGRFVLRGAGWGHGVGLCQIGAAVMADKGYTHEQILAHYYRGADLTVRY
jgi:stage II sporulation protein D